MADELLITEPRPGVRLLTLNRPEARNALSNTLLAAIAEALERAQDDDAVRCAVLAGSDKVFAAGADIRELAGRDTATALTELRPRLWERIRRFPKPLIACVRGWALGGGCELALHADIIVAGEGAKLGQPEINLGIMPGAGGTQRLARLLGPGPALRLCLSGEAIAAAEAKEIGLIAEVAPDAAALDRALALAETIAAKPPLAARLIKEVVLAALDMPLEAGLALERKAFSALLATRDFKEGTAAFLEKRAAKFEGR